MTFFLLWLVSTISGHNLRTYCQVMLQMEQEQQAADDARRYAEDDAAAQRNVANALQVVVKLVLDRPILYAICSLISTRCFI